MARIELTNGNWVEMSDPSILRNRDRKAIIAASDQVEGTASGALALVEELISRLIDSWSFDLPVPSVDQSSLDELEIPDINIIENEADKAREVLFPDFSPKLAATNGKVPQLVKGSPTAPS